MQPITETARSASQHLRSQDDRVVWIPMLTEQCYSLFPRPWDLLKVDTPISGRLRNLALFKWMQWCKTFRRLGSTVLIFAKTALEQVKFLHLHMFYLK